MSIPFSVRPVVRHVPTSPAGEPATMAVRASPFLGQHGLARRRMSPFAWVKYKSDDDDRDDDTVPVRSTFRALAMKWVKYAEQELALVTANCYIRTKPKAAHLLCYILFWVICVWNPDLLLDRDFSTFEHRGNTFEPLA